ncbi:hypothetical protein D3C86_2134920 [compost metagenome]
MGEYKGKIIGNQNSCCEENRKVVQVHSDNEDFDISLSVECEVCNNKWTEVLD